MDFLLKQFFSIPTLLIIFGGLAVAIFGFVGSILKDLNTPRWISVGTLFGGLLVLSGGIWSGYIENRNMELLQNRTNQIFSLSIQNTKLSNKIAQLSNKNAELNTYIVESITGGDSFCYYELGFPWFTENILYAMLIHVGKYPLHDLYIKILDGNKLDKLVKKYNKTPIPGDKIRETKKTIHKPTLFKRGQAGLGSEDQYFKLPVDQTEQSYSIFFSARNDEWHQIIKLKRIENKWTFATRVTYLRKEKRSIVLFERVLSDFPRNKDGKIDW